MNRSTNLKLEHHQSHEEFPKNVLSKSLLYFYLIDNRFYLKTLRSKLHEL